MKNFRSFLQEKCRIPDKKVPFYMYWISKYNTFSKGRTPGDTDLVKSFLKVLSQKYEEWQVKQAEKAISLYFFFTAGGLSANTDVEPQFLPKIPSDWKSSKGRGCAVVETAPQVLQNRKNVPGLVKKILRLFEL